MKKLLSPILLVVLAACGDNNKDIQQIRFDEVMVIHDEVMPLMGTIRTLQKDIRSEMANVTLDTTGVGQEEALTMLDEFEDANKAMMDWMHNFSKPSDGRSHEEIMDYYNQEFDKISLVKQQMLNAIERGK